MTAARPLTLALLAATVALSGCISLFPKAKPAQLYRFGAAVAPPAPVNPAAKPVRLLQIGFPVAAAGDNILTIDGDQAAYVGGGRWVSSAATLFEAAVVQTFDARGGPTRILARGELVPAVYALKLDVRRFETRYDQGAGAPPTVVVEVYAALDSPTDATRGRQRLFTAMASASDNRIGPIAAAYDIAVREVCGEMIDWVGAGDR